MDFGIVGVAGISVICWLIGQIVKATGIDNKWIPCIVGVVGGMLGVAGLYIIPDYPAQELITAIAGGIVSGMAATGADQIGKQLGGGSNG